MSRSRTDAGFRFGLAAAAASLWITTALATGLSGPAPDDKFSNASPQPGTRQ